MAVQQQNLQIKLDTAQLGYSEEQRKELGSSYHAPVVEKLPVSLEELRQLVPEYENMTEEEQQEVDSVLMIQAMINASMNEMLTAQANYQYTFGIQQWSAQLEAVNEAVSDGAHALKMSKLEKGKQELLAQFYALQSYYEIMGLQVDIRAAQFEVQAAQSAVKDAKTLHRLGLATKREVEQAEQAVVQHQQSLQQAQKQAEAKKNTLKQILGLKKQDTMLLPQVDSMKLIKNFDTAAIDLKKQIDHIKAEEASNHALAKLETAKSKHLSLSDYLHTLLVVEVEKKTIVDQWLEEKAELLHYEQESIQLGKEELQEQHETLVIRLEDYKTLYLNGTVSEREYEAVSNELTRLMFSLEKVELQHFIWQEKKRIAVLGVLQ